MTNSFDPKPDYQWNDISLYKARSAPADQAEATRPPIDLTRLKVILAKLNVEQLKEILDGLPEYKRLMSLKQGSKYEGNVVQQNSSVENTEPDRRNTETDRRKSRRLQKLLSAKISTNELMSATDCVIRNQSESGCGISVNSTIGVPHHFKLHILNGNIKRECEVIWRQSNMIGVRYLDGSDSNVN